MTGSSQIAIPFVVGFLGAHFCVLCFVLTKMINAQLIIEAPEGVDPQEYQDQVDATLEAIEIYKEEHSFSLAGASFKSGFLQGYLAAADVDYDEDLVELLSAVAS